MGSVSRQGLRPTTIPPSHCVRLPSRASLRDCEGKWACFMRARVGYCGGGQVQDPFFYVDMSMGRSDDEGEMATSAFETVHGLNFDTCPPTAYKHPGIVSARRPSERHYIKLLASCASTFWSIRLNPACRLVSSPFARRSDVRGRPPLYLYPCPSSPPALLSCATCIFGPRASSFRCPVFYHPSVPLSPIACALDNRPAEAPARVKVLAQTGACEVPHRLLWEAGAVHHVGDLGHPRARGTPRPRRFDGQ